MSVGSSALWEGETRSGTVRCGVRGVQGTRIQCRRWAMGASGMAWCTQGKAAGGQWGLRCGSRTERLPFIVGCAYLLRCRQGLEGLRGCGATLPAMRIAAMRRTFATL